MLSIRDLETRPRVTLLLAQPGFWHGFYPEGGPYLVHPGSLGITHNTSCCQETSSFPKTLMDLAISYLAYFRIPIYYFFFRWPAPKAK